jgi:hypothetical protein
MVIFAPHDDDIKQMAHVEYKKEQLEFDDDAKKMMEKIGLDADDIKAQLDNMVGKF